MSRMVFLVTLIWASTFGPAPAAATDVSTIYANRCAFCHGTTGRGDGPAGIALKPPPRNLADPEFWKSADPEALKAIVSNGKPGTAMVPFKDTLSPEEIAALVEHLKTFNPQQ